MCMRISVAFAACLMLAPGASAQEILDSQTILERLTGTAAPAPRTRSIVAEPVRPAPAEAAAYAAVSLPAVQFEYDSARLTGKAEGQLRELAATLGSEQLDGVRFALEGHTDSRGDASYNRNLSQRRAESVKRYLVDVSGVAGDRLVPLGVGEDRLLRGIGGEDARNRRVEVVKLGRVGGGAAPAVAGSSSAVDARALLIGIDDYRTVSDLLGAPRQDVAAMRRFVAEDLGFETDRIRTLLDEQATRDNILANVRDWLVRGERALLYFSGHGHQQPDENGDEADGFDETLVPYDATEEGGVANGMILDDEISEILAGAEGVAIDLVVDACHSGTLTRSLAGPADYRFVKSPRTLDGKPLRRGGAATRSIVVESAGPQPFVDATSADVRVWSAVRADQKALVEQDSAPPHKAVGSVFTNDLLAGLRGRADADGDRVVSARELEEFVRRESEAYCSGVPYCTAGLTPEVSVPDGQLDARAFASVGPGPARTRGIAALAKDILVSPGRRGEGTDDAVVDIALHPGADLREGDTLEVTVESGVSGTLVLLDFDAQDRMTQVFPNEWSGSTRIEKGVALRIPDAAAGFRLRARPPFGQGKLVAVVTDGELPGALTSLHKDLSVVARPEGYLAELAGQLRHHQPDGSWGYGEFVYEVRGR